MTRFTCPYIHLNPSATVLRFLLVLGCLLVFKATHGQLKHATFVPVAPEELSSSFIRCIYKDAKGYVWFGTATGLIRYDGTNTYKYEHNPLDHKSIPSNRINAIVEDKDKNLWIGTGQGLVIYDREKDAFLNIDSIQGNNNYLINKYVSTLSIDGAGKIWVGTHGDGLNIYDPKSKTFTYLSEKSDSERKPSCNYIVSLLLIGDTMWAGTKGGLKLFDTRRLRQEPVHLLDESIKTKEVTQIVSDRIGNIWLSTFQREIIKLTPDKGNYKITKTQLDRNMNGELGGAILTMYFDAGNNLWIGGEKCGLNYLDTRTNEILAFEAEEGNPKKIPTNSIRSVYVDNTGITWIGTYNKGVYLIDGKAKKFDVFQRNLFTNKKLTGNNVKGIAEDREGNIWVALDGGGLCKVASSSHELIYQEDINKKLNTRYLTALRSDSDGNLWIGTWGQGLYKLNPATLELKNYKFVSHGFGDNIVFSIFEDKQKKIWVGSIGSGLFFLDKQKEQFVPLKTERKESYLSNTAYISSIIQDSDDAYWVATLYGLYKLKFENENKFEFTRYSKGDQPITIGSNEVYTVYEDKNQDIWFGTGDNGLTVLNRRSSTFENFQRKDGLLSRRVAGLLPDAQGNIWISGNMGLARYDSKKDVFRNYTKDDGLPSNGFNANAFLKASDGKFYFGTDNGLVAFYPDSIRDNTTPPQVYLTDLKINNISAPIGEEGSPLTKHISLTDHIELSYDQPSFVLDFVALTYGQSSKNQYCYKLEGFDDNWNCVGSRNSATYTNLDPGNYVFLVKASNNGGAFNETATKLNITVHPAPWKSWWAKLSYVLGVTLLILLFIRLRDERIKIKNQLEYERLAREKEHALMEYRTQFFTNISHEFRTPLSLISMPLENLKLIDDLPVKVKERLDMMNNSVDKMMRLVNELMDFSKLESSKLKLRVERGELIGFINKVAHVFDDMAAKRKINFGIHSKVKSVEGWFDHDKLEKILANLLSNAFKFTSENGQINIVIDALESSERGDLKKRRIIQIVVIDNGIGIAPEELPYIFDKFFQAKSSTKIANSGTGIGLSLTKGLLELHHGSINVESTPNHETKFTIQLPIDRSAYSEDDISETPGCILAPSESQEAEMAAICEEPETVDTDKPLILVVEDNDELRNYIFLELSSEYNIIEAKDGEEGLTKALERSPDLIISDILMPLKTGIELCADIKNNLKTSHIPFILLSAKATLEDQIAGVSSGADLYITKPFSIRYLIVHINQIIQSRQKLFARFSQDVYLMPGKLASNEIDEAFLQKAIDYIVSNIQDPQLGVDSIADLFNLSRMQIYRKIKALTGKSVVDFIRMVRMKQALKLLDTEQYTISEIAYLTGFSSASYFTRCFKDEYGKAPSEYLEQRV